MNSDLAKSIFEPLRRQNASILTDKNEVVVGRKSTDNENMKIIKIE